MRPGLRLIYMTGYRRRDRKPTAALSIPQHSFYFLPVA